MQRNFLMGRNLRGEKNLTLRKDLFFQITANKDLQNRFSAF